MVFDVFLSSLSYHYLEIIPGFIVEKKNFTQYYAYCLTFHFKGHFKGHLIGHLRTFHRTFHLTFHWAFKTFHRTLNGHLLRHFTTHFQGYFIGHFIRYYFDITLLLLIYKIFLKNDGKKFNLLRLLNFWNCSGVNNCLKLQFYSTLYPCILTS